MRNRSKYPSRTRSFASRAPFSLMVVLLRRMKSRRLCQACGRCQSASWLSLRKPGDDEVANYVRAALDAHSEVMKAAITVSVSGGVVTLEGSVCDTWQHAVAEDVARSARGVRDVRNRLVVDLLEQIKDEEVSYEIQSAIHHICGLSGAGIKVAVSDRAVVLSGTVTTLPAKERAERLARNYGALNVRNDIEVTPNDKR